MREKTFNVNVTVRMERELWNRTKKELEFRTDNPDQDEDDGAYAAVLSEIRIENDDTIIVHEKQDWNEFHGCALHNLNRYVNDKLNRECENSFRIYYKKGIDHKEQGKYDFELQKKETGYIDEYEIESDHIIMKNGPICSICGDCELVIDPDKIEEIDIVMDCRN